MRNLRYIFLLVAAISFAAPSLNAQVSINTDGTAPHTSAMLEVKSTSKGLLIPRLTTVQRTTLGASATAGLMVYDTDLNKFYYHNGSGWLEGSVGGFWTRNGTNLYNTNTGDNVGIGTATPGYVAGAARYFSIAGPTGGGAQTVSLELKGFSGVTFNPVAKIDFLSHSSIGTIYNIGRIESRITNAQYEGELLFYTNNGTLTERLRIDRNGYVGIGTSTPGRPLEIYGGSSPLRLNSSAVGVGMEFMSSTATDWGIMTWGNNLRFVTSTDNFTTTADEYFFDQNEFTPWTNGTKTIGSSAKRFNKLYFIDGNFSGNVGIGVTIPVAKLQVADGVNGSLRIGSNANWYAELSYNYGIGDFVIQSGNSSTATGADIIFKTYGKNRVIFNGSGEVGIGTLNPLAKFHVHDSILSNTTLMITPATTVSGDSSKLFMGEDAIGYYGMYWLYDGTSNNMQLYGKSGTTSFGPHFSVNRNTGNAAFGSIFATGYKLSVSGKIICEELRVNLVASWPDYVFKKDYALLPVEQLGSYVEENGHLPNVPAAAEVEKTGLDVGNMQKIMMEKIEELSLYIIEQQKQIKELKEQVNELKNK